MHAALPAPSWLSVGDVTKGLRQLSKMAAAGERQRWQEQSRPLWKRPICSPGCAFGNYFRLCDVNTANPVVWFNHTTEPHRHAARASRTFCTRSPHLCTCAPRCPKCNRLSDTRGRGPVQVSRSWKGTSANWEEAPDCAGESHTTIFFGSHVQDIKMTRERPTKRRVRPNPNSHVVDVCRLGWNLQISGNIQINQCGSLVPQCKKILKNRKNSLLPVRWQWHTFSQNNHCHRSLNDAASTRLARAHHGEQSTTMLHVFVFLMHPAIWSKFRHSTVMFFCIFTRMPSCLGGSSS